MYNKLYINVLTLLQTQAVKLKYKPETLINLKEWVFVKFFYIWFDF
jgi:hypothetical protein